MAILSKPLKIFLNVVLSNSFITISYRHIERISIFPKGPLVLTSLWSIQTLIRFIKISDNEIELDCVMGRPPRVAKVC